MKVSCTLFRFIIILSLRYILLRISLFGMKDYVLGPIELACYSLSIKRLERKGITETGESLTLSFSGTLESALRRA
jgi:hypothetical protein